MIKQVKPLYSVSPRKVGGVMIPYSVGKMKSWMGRGEEMSSRKRWDYKRRGD